MAAALFGVGLGICASFAARADTISMVVVSPANYSGANTIAATLHADVHDNGDGTVTFDFYSDGPSSAASTIDAIYFHDGPFIDPATASIQWISTSQSGVSWAAGSNPDHLPGEPKSWVDMTFNSQDTGATAKGIDTYTGSLAGWDGSFANPTTPGSYPGDYVQLTFKYVSPTETLADLETAFNNGSFNIGFHVQNEGGSGKSDSFIGGTWTPSTEDTPPAAPAPATLGAGLLLLGSLPLLQFARRRAALR